MFENLTSLEYEKKKSMVIVTLNRPRVHNAINLVMLQELDEVISQVSKDDSIRVLIITGSGNKSFSSGSDIKELLELDPLKAQRYSKLGQNVFHRLENLEKIVVTAVNGNSVGAAIEIIMASDIVVASENSTFGWPEIHLGIIPCWGGTQRLPRIVGKLKAKELIFTGKIIGPDEALQLGLINTIVPSPRLMIEAERIAEDLSRNPVTSMQKAKAALNLSAECELYSGMKHESQLFGLSFAGKTVHKLLSAWRTRTRHRKNTK